MIHPDLHYQLWEQENEERIRRAARRQAIREARLTREAEGPRETSTERNWLTVLGDGVLRLRRLWTAS